MKKLLTLSEKLSKYLVAAALVVIPLLPKFPLVKVTGTYVAIRFEDVLMVLLALTLIPKIVLDYKKLWKDKIVKAILIFFMVTLLSVVAGVLITDTVQVKIGILHWARRVEYMIPFLVTYLLIPKEKIKESIAFYFKILILEFLIIFLYGLGQRYMHFPVIITQNAQYSKGIALRWTPGAHINSTFAGHYDLSAYMVLILPVLISSIFVFKNKVAKLILTLTSGMGLWLLINSISRTAQASYLVAVTIALFILKKFKGWVAVVAISLVCMFLSSGLDARFTQAIKALYEHLSTGESFGYVTGFVVRAEGAVTSLSPTPIATPVPTPAATSMVNDVSIAIRVNVEWPRALRAFIKNPILGTGYSSIDLATDNDYLRMLGETGILGLFAFGLIILRIGNEFIKAFKIRESFDGLEKTFIFGILAGAVGTFMTAILIDLFEASKFAMMFWLLLGCSVSLIKYKLNEQ